MNAVHTSALDDAGADLFGEVPAPAGRAESGILLQIQGELLEDAQVRSKPVGDGVHVRPVLWLNLRPLTPERGTYHIEQIYTEATRKEAEARAAALKKGARVTVTTPVTDMRVTFPHVREVALIQG